MRHPPNEGGRLHQEAGPNISALTNATNGTILRGDRPADVRITADPEREIAYATGPRSLAVLRELGLLGERNLIHGWLVSADMLPEVQALCEQRGLSCVVTARRGTS